MAVSGISTTGVSALADATVEAAVSGSDYRSQLSMLLPRGKSWTRELTSNLQQLLSGAARTFDRIHVRGNELLEEMDPRTARETIGDWERITKPYGNEEPPTDLAERRAAVTSVWTSRGAWAGGPSLTFFASLATTFGYQLTIRRFHRQPFKCTSKCTDNLNTARAGWYYVWEFIVLSNGEARDAVFAGRIQQYALGHLAVTIAFPLLDPAAATFTRASTAVLKNPSRQLATALASGQRGDFYDGV